MPVNLSYYHYSSSLTTPPCSEVVSWYVVKSPLDASVDLSEIASTTEGFVGADLELLVKEAALHSYQYYFVQTT